MKDDSTKIGDFILQKLKEKDRSISWLAKQVGRDKGNLHRTLKNSQYIHYDLIYRISKALGEDFHAYGSQKLKESCSCENNNETL